MVSQGERQAIIDDSHLQILSVTYWISAGFVSAYALFMAAYFIFIGVMFLAIPFEEAGAPPAAFAWTWIGFGIVGILVMAAVVTLKALAGFWIRNRTHRIATMVVAALSCLEFPYGTAIGVFTFVVLARPSVAALYESQQSGGGEAAAQMDERNPAGEG